MRGFNRKSNHSAAFFAASAANLAAFRAAAAASLAALAASCFASLVAFANALAAARSSALVRTGVVVGVVDAAMVELVAATVEAAVVDPSPAPTLNDELPPLEFVLPESPVPPDPLPSPSP